MANTSFSFKQFVVHQQHCAMKVNTDGVLLGAWASTDIAKRILDIGTGTGVIALMMAQTFPSAIVDAIDIDASAAVQAKDNFLNSLWSQRLQVFHSALQEFQPLYSYDLIISNPPYFVNDLKPLDERKSVAKHSIDLTYDELLAHANRLLSANGKLALVVPYFNKALLLTKAATLALFPSKILNVKARDDKAPYLALLILEKREGLLNESDLSIQGSSGEFTQQYKALTQAYYLKF